MDLSDLASPQAAVASDPDGRSPDVGGWPVAAQLGSEVATPLTHALEATCLMQASGRIDRHSLQALHDHIEQARAASMLAQQIARLAQGGIQQQDDAVNLAQALRDAVGAREHDLQARGLSVKQSVQPAEIVGDATLLSALLNALLEWSLHHTRTAVEFRLDTKPWPAHARLTCRFGHVPPDQALAHGNAHHRAAATHEAALDCLRWHLLVQLARTMQLIVARDHRAADTTLTLEFPRTANASLGGASAIEWDGSCAATSEAPPLRGTRVLVIALRRDVGNQIRQAVLHMGLMLDFVSSVEAARECCQRSMPHAIVYEGSIYDIAFDTLRHDIRRQCPDVAWIEIIEQGEAFEISSFGGTSMARVGRDAIAASLPSALLFELTKSL